MSWSFPSTRRFLIETLSPRFGSVKLRLNARLRTDFRQRGDSSSSPSYSSLQ
jgi:hypothetical protein